MAFNTVEKVRDLVPLKTALVSVYDKGGLEGLLGGLASSCPGLVLYSTGGSATAIGDFLAGRGRGLALSLIQVSDYTGQAEMAGGLVKTLDWRIYLGLLAEDGNPSHAADLEARGAVAIDLVVGDLYPFEAAAAARAAPEALRQRIDIGGPAMLRAGAKNFLRVASVSSPSQYGALLEELATRGGQTSLEFRRRLAAAAFARTAAFDAAIAETLQGLGPADLGAAYSLA